MRSRCQLADACSVLSDQSAEIGAGQHQGAEAGGNLTSEAPSFLVDNVRVAITCGEQVGWDVASQARLGRLVGELIVSKGKERLS